MSAAQIIMLVASSVLTLYGAWLLFCVLELPETLARRRARRREQTHAGADAAVAGDWNTYVEPGVTGPTEPEGGFKILVAEKRRETGADGNVEIHFQAALYCYFTKRGRVRVGRRSYLHKPGWARIGTALETSADLIEQELDRMDGRLKEVLAEFEQARDQIEERRRSGEFSGGFGAHDIYEQQLAVAERRRDRQLRTLKMRSTQLRKKATAVDAHWRVAPDLPAEVWPAQTPIEELASAWFDYQAKIDAINEHEWQRQTLTRAESVAADKQAVVDEQERETQRQIADLLPGPTVDGVTLSSQRSI